jgi:hypothetical protein
VLSVARGATVSAIVVSTAMAVPLEPAGSSASARTSAATVFVRCVTARSPTRTTTALIAM